MQGYRSGPVACGVAAAVVAALVAVVGYLIGEVILDIDLIPTAELIGGSGDTDSVLAQYIVVGVVAALAATALLHVLLLTTPGRSPSSAGS
jgi:hypothetical protein